MRVRLLGSLLINSSGEAEAGLVSVDPDWDLRMLGGLLDMSGEVVGDELLNRCLRCFEDTIVRKSTKLWPVLWISREALPHIANIIPKNRAVTVVYYLHVVAKMFGASGSPIRLIRQSMTKIHVQGRPALGKTPSLKIDEPHKSEARALPESAMMMRAFADRWIPPSLFPGTIPQPRGRKQLR